ncbi:MAG: M24 family metallopeptidase [Candidatus Caldatribacteriaceae bacterium]
MTLPQRELKTRLKRVQELLKTQILAAALIFYNEWDTANGWYLSGWCPQFESGCVFVPQEGEPMILGGPESEPFAKTDSAIPKTRNIPVFMVPEEEYPNARISSFQEVFAEVGIPDTSRIGIVGLSNLPLGIYQQIREELYRAEIVDVTFEYERLRRIKSPWEIETIRKAFALADQGFQAMEPLVQENCQEVVIAAAGEGKVRSLGANWFAFQTIVASGPRSNAVVPTASERKIQRGETVMLGLSPRYQGYAGVFGYTMVAGGKPTDAQKSCLAELSEAYRITKLHLKPGMQGKDLDALPREFLTKRGYAPYLVCPFVHTIGLREAEPPFFGPHSNDILEAGMTVCIDVSVFSVPEVCGVRLESGYLITEGGAEPLSPFMERKILELGE